MISSRRPEGCCLTSNGSTTSLNVSDLLNPEVRVSSQTLPWAYEPGHQYQAYPLMGMNAGIADTAKMVMSAISEKNLAVFPNSSGSLMLLLGLGLGFSRYDLIDSKPMVIFASRIKEAGHGYIRGKNSQGLFQLFG